MRGRLLSVAAGLALLVAVGATTGAARPGYQNGLIAYTRCCSAGIFTIRPDGGGKRLVYRALYDDAPLTPSWSPDGKSIAYAPGAPQGGIWVMDAAGRHRHRVTAGKGDATQPAWSPNGRTLVFVDLRAKGSRFYDLFSVRADGTGAKRLTTSRPEEGNPAWAPNGGVIAYNRGRDLWIMRADGSGQRLLARNAASPAWSPGGTRIAFLRAGDPWVMSRDGSGARQIADLDDDQYKVVWSPDSRWLATAPIDRGDVMLVRADGSETRPLTHESGWFHGWPSWQRVPSRS
jgi:Tol biopolymer transport system component